MITTATVALFVNLIIGHFVGDYLLQNQWMALTKSRPGRQGDIACTAHVMLYTLSVASWADVWSPWFLAAVFIPHWIIDRWSVGNLILTFKNGYGLMETWKHDEGTLEMQIWKLAFAAPIYIMNDNTLHFVCLAITAAIWGAR